MKKEYWSLKKAIEYAKSHGIEISKPTLIKWIRRYAIGFQLGDTGGKWYVFSEKYKRYIHGGNTETGTKPNIIISSEEIENDGQKS